MKALQLEIRSQPHLPTDYFAGIPETELPLEACQVVYSGLMKLFTIGYEGRSPKEFAKLLKDNNVRVLVDVRETARSRARGFSAHQLMETLLKAGIDYRHERELGNPIEIRSLFHDGKLAEGRNLYGKLLSNGRRASVDRLIDLVANEKQVCIMCVERDVTDCHRDLIARKVTRLEPTIEVVNL